MSHQKCDALFPPKEVVGVAAEPCQGHVTRSKRLQGGSAQCFDILDICYSQFGGGNGNDEFIVNFEWICGLQIGHAITEHTLEEFAQRLSPWACAWQLPGACR